MEGLSVGRIVHVRTGRLGARECRAAMIVRVWGDSGTVNLSVFPDWTNDIHDGSGAGIVWMTSIQHESQLSEENRALADSWHWPERV